MTFSEFIKSLNGYETKTTFWSDFSIADAFGNAAIIDTFERAFKEWCKDVEYITELSLVLNHKGWFYYDRDNERAKLYFNLYNEVDDWCRMNLQGEDAEYYFRVTD